MRLQNATKLFTTPAGEFRALENVSLDIGAGEFAAITGKSGSGKSTLLNVMAGIDRPSAGNVLVSGTAVHDLKEAMIAPWRGRTIGFVFQFFQLLPTLTVLENVMLPMDFCRTFPLRERKPRALALLERVGIAAQADKLPAALSGGEQQRAAVARALANDPPLILADEPTGNLDSHTADTVLALFRRLNADGKTIVMVTHEPVLAGRVDRVVTLADGRIIHEENN